MTGQEYTAALEKLMATPGNVACVAMVLAGFRPVVPPAPGGDNMTSREICTALEDVCVCTLEEVALAMTTLGYRLHVNAYRGLEWAMQAHHVNEN